jgi:hypothetical protein
MKNELEELIGNPEKEKQLIQFEEELECLSIKSMFAESPTVILTSKSKPRTQRKPCGKRKKAMRKAEDEAGDHVFPTENTSKYEAQGWTRIKEPTQP